MQRNNEEKMVIRNKRIKGIKRGKKRGRKSKENQKEAKVKLSWNGN